MTLTVHHAPGTAPLADGLARLLARPLADAFAEEVVIVPAKGVERWLTQRLSHHLGARPGHHDGVCAGVRFLSPRSLVALLTGTELEDPWDPDRLVWPLLQVVDSSMDEPWCATLAAHLGRGATGEQAELRQDRRYSVVRRIAGLFAAYAAQRPTVLVDWEAGRDTDGAGADLPRDLRWQAELWRRVVAAVAVPTPARRHDMAIEAIRAGGTLPLPDRLSMFGHTRLAVTELRLLGALTDVRQVHLWLPQASPVGWAKLSPLAATGPVRRRLDHSASALAHPLLSSLGRDSRELQRSLTLLTGPDPEVDEVPLPEGPLGAPDTLLGWLQADLRADAPTPDGRRLHPDDASVQVHACHGATRQVEVLREVLVGLLADDPTLEPRDIVVMCPDVEAYAPLFSASFGLGSQAGDQAHPAHGLRLRLADRGLASTNPLLALAAALLALAGGRGTASEVLDLAASTPVRNRFALTGDDMATLAGWVARAGVRWGLTPGLRAPYHLQRFAENTWQAGVDRVLLGAAMAEEGARHVGGVIPLDDVGSADIDLAGRLAELLARLAHHVGVLQRTVEVADWVSAVGEAVRDLGSVRAEDEWQMAQFERELDTVRQAYRGVGPGAGQDVGYQASQDAEDGAEPGAVGTEPEAVHCAAVRLRLAEMTTLLDHRVQPRPTRANFRTGHLTVSTMVPMRSVPHRVVALVGLDDGSFPRNAILDGDDVLARDPMTGERDPRSEDRQLLLDAVLAAGQTVVVTYTGANEHSGAVRPPAVPVGELLDSLDRTVPGGRDHALRRHRLQPFDARNFSRPADNRTAHPGGSFDRAGLAGAVAGGQPRRPRPPLLTEPLAPLVGESADEVALTELRAFLLHPVRGFLRGRLDVGVPAEYEDVRDDLPVEIDALERWAVGDRILREVLAGQERQDILTAALLRGDLPPHHLGRRQLSEITQRVGQLLEASAADRQAAARSVDVALDLGKRRRVTGVVGGVVGHRIVRVHYSSLRPKQRLASWVDLLALSAAYPDQSWTASTYGWDRTGPRQSLLQPVGHVATELVAALVDLRDRGLGEPLPLPLVTGHAWADARRAHRDPEQQASRAWYTQDRSPVPGEVEDPYHERTFGRGAAFEVLLGEPPVQERWSSERTRLGQLSRRLWDPIFAYESVRQR